MPTQPYIVDGERVPGVTTVLGKFKDADPLMYWSWNTAHKVLIEAVDMMRQKQNSASLQAFLKTDPLERANYRKESKKASDAGTVAHDIVSRWIHSPIVSRGRFLESVNLRFIMLEYNVYREIADAAMKAVRGFERWLNQNQFSLHATEVPLLSRIYRYGGTIDCLGRLQSQLVLFDWKTSGGVYIEYLAQLAAYRQLWNENNQEQVEGGQLIRFDKESGDFTHYSFTDLGDAFQYFLLLRQAYDLAAKLKKRLA